MVNLCRVGVIDDGHGGVLNVAQLRPPRRVASEVVAVYKNAFECWMGRIDARVDHRDNSRARYPVRALHVRQLDDEGGWLMDITIPNRVAVVADRCCVPQPTWRGKARRMLKVEYL